MASNNSGGVHQSPHYQQQQQQQQQHSNTSPHHCKECGLYLNSAKSLEVHLQYHHKENLLTKWATQAATSHSEETNNNNTKANLKREFIPNNTVAPADSSDSTNKKSSPDYSRTTPESVFGHPPSPQSYQSASSPYQSHDNSAFSPNFQNYPMKQERTSVSPNSHYNQHNYNFGDSQFFTMEANQNQQQYGHDFSPMHKVPGSVQNQSYRYHPYQQYDRTQSNSQVSSSSPAYPPQPTPSPSPKQCDKCGYVCDSASQLIDHQNVAHPPTPASHMSSYHSNQHFLFNADPQHTQIKTEDDTQSEILDLDSHKVHQVYPEDEKRQSSEMNGPNPHSVTALLNSWSPPQQKIYHPQQFINGPPPTQIHNHEYMGNNVTTTSQDSIMSQGYRAFEHLPAQPNAPVITSTQVPNSQPPTTGSQTTKSANWKSNEARRPKTYNCTACNKWFTSSGHLKRHYNTTLHKNAVKSSGQPDPASLPISAHHHPAREPTNKEDQSGSPIEEDTNSMPMPYDRQQPPPNIQHSPLASLNSANLNLSNGSPPNGDAGLSPTNIDSRGLLSTIPHGFMAQPPHMMPMDNPPQYQMYPNGSAPHVTQVTATISSLNITGETQHQIDAVAFQQDSQPLPSFAQFQRYGLVMSYGDANVGGGGPATAPFCYYPDPFESETRTLMYKTDEDEYRLTVLTAADPAPTHEELVPLPSISSESLPSPPSPEKAHTSRDLEESTGSPRITSTVPTVPGTSQSLYKCVECDKNFNKACYLTQHNKTFHSGDKPFKCTRCGKRFSNQETYEEHIAKHAGDKPHKCSSCPKQFNHKTDLRRHMCLHTGNKPYRCDTCGKGFIRKDHMLKHCETHYRKTQNKVRRDQRKTE